MSASVFQPVTRALRAPRRTPYPSPTVDSHARGRVSRCLFGPIDHEATRQFVASELANIARYDQQRWGFDFEHEQPLNSKHQRYVWQRVKPTTTTSPPVHQAYALRGMAFLSTHADDTTTPRASSLSSSSSSSSPITRTKRTTSTSKLRQAKITEFTKVQRKRPNSFLVAEMKKMASATSGSASWPIVIASSTSKSRMSETELELGGPPPKQARTT